MTVRVAILAAAALLSACSGGDGGNNSSSGAVASQPEAPVNLTVDQGNMAVPLPAATPTSLATLPPGFQGRWGTVAEDCDPAKGYAAKGLITIAGKRLSFYESRGDASNIRETRPDEISFDLPMSGEGQNWQEPTRLTLSHDGRTLTRQAQGPKDRAGAFTYQKCPA